MSKFAMEKKTVLSAAAEEQVKHRHVPGVAYEINDPYTKLIFTIGGGFFNEPKYYDTNRSDADFYAELLAQGKITSKITDDKGLTEQAREVLETITACANGDRPEDLFVIAAWARDKTNGLRMRTTPQMALVIGAQCEKSKPFVAKYATAIMQRPDEIRQVFAAYRHLFQTQAKGSSRPHKGGLPHCLRKALALTLAEASEYGLLKYDGTDRPTFGDVLKMVRGVSIRNFLEKNARLNNQTFNQANWPLSKAMFEYLVNGKVVEGAPPIILARQEFMSAKAEDLLKRADLPDLIHKAGLTWENTISHLGSSKQTWELVIPEMSEMALTRNLRNFEQAGISKEAWDKVYEKLLGMEESVQLPFRWFTAHRQVTSTEAKSVVGLKLDQACERLPDLPGITVAFTDNSGSAVGCPVSGKSDLRVADCGNILEAVLAKKLGRRAKIAVFGDSLIWIPFSQADSCMAIKEKIDACAQRDERSTHGALAFDAYKRGTGVGGGTETGLWWGLHDLIERKEKVDRIIIMSDFCCYTQGNAGFVSYHRGRSEEQVFGKDASIQGLVDKYRRTVNPDCRVYSINLNGHGQAQTRPSDTKTQLLSGWSEKIFDIIRETEGVQQVQGGEIPVELPTIEVIRQRYKR
jgi:hypothetical protein